MKDGLFPEPPHVRSLGITARRTALRAWLIRIGLHPLSTTLRKSLKIGPAETCGTCRFCQPLDRDVPVSQTSYKCWYRQGERVTRGHATDIRKSWPACTDWMPRDRGEDEQDHPD